MIALIPARAGSTRIPGKNTKLLAGHPLLAYTIEAARASQVFDLIVVCTDDDATARLASEYGADNRVAGPPCHVDTCCDITWVTDALRCWNRRESFAILRPTSPFRGAETIQRAYAQFQRTQDTKHSLRAVRSVTEHPYKMWTLGDELTPFWPGKHADGTPYHSSPTQALPAMYVQTSALEMAWTWVVESFGTISGRKVAPFLTYGYDNLTLDTPDDWHYAEYLVETQRAALPVVAPVPVADVPAATPG